MISYILIWYIIMGGGSGDSLAREMENGKYRVYDHL